MRKEEEEDKYSFVPNPIVELSEYILWENATRCRWRCPFCGERCVGMVGHEGRHQCGVHKASPCE